MAAKSRLTNLLNHFLPSSASPTVPTQGEGKPIDDLVIDNHRVGRTSWYNHHTLSPTSFLPRAAAIEPDALAIYHRTANNKVLRRTYIEFADRARGFAYFLRKKGYKRVGILCANTPAFLEAIYGIGAAGSINIAINYRLKKDDIAYIFDHAEADSIIVDAEYLDLLDDYRQKHPNVPIIIDTDTDAIEGELSGPFDQAVLEGLQYDRSSGSQGWDGLEVQAPDEVAVNALAYTSGTTARPKGVEYTYRGCYLGALGNVIESGLAYHDGERCKYLWTLPMFHAMGWTFPWAVTAARGTHYCLRKIDYPEIWRLLKDERITHYCAAPTVNTLLCADSNATKLPKPVRVTVAASPPTAHLFEQMTNLNLHPVHVYGMTETYGPITKGYMMPEWHEYPNIKDKYAKMARQGHGFVTSLPARVIKTEVPEGTIVDVEKDGKEIGEIVFIGNICARGYYKDETATRKLFLGGVLHSGDLAVWHEDGAIQILDRAKDIIISGGENISSVALESLLVTHPDMLECGVAAVSDSHWGERPKAFITMKPGSQTTGEDVIQWAKDHPGISKFMVPREVEIVPELPKTSTGKIRKNILREWAKGAKREAE
ncbi:fatty-acyl-CoA synthase [Exophiala viscosa]|uniref:Fatty-acyl-CoA synthase n=1 Tax=Exophiala viscosa TaxID=2486360 RepID=A0AAN6E2V8_9EURO|nr:fatty-acyl-CoA synthase [Exophiala viscosa]